MRFFIAYLGTLKVSSTSQHLLYFLLSMKRKTSGVPNGLKIGRENILHIVASSWSRVRICSKHRGSIRSAGQGASWAIEFDLCAAILYFHQLMTTRGNHLLWMIFWYGLIYLLEKYRSIHSQEKWSVRFTLLSCLILSSLLSMLVHVNERSNQDY